MQDPDRRYDPGIDGDCGHRDERDQKNGIVPEHLRNRVKVLWYINLSDHAGVTPDRSSCGFCRFREIRIDHASANDIYGKGGFPVSQDRSEYNDKERCRHQRFDQGPGDAQIGSAVFQPDPHADQLAQ